MAPSIRYGLMGCGGFGRFCFGQYLSLPGLECVAVADQDEALAQKTAAEFGVAAIPPAELLARDDIDLIHLATPPWTHGPLGLQALHAGKHLLCEKPLAVTMEEALALTNASRDKKLVLAVNMMMRYSPLCQGVKKLVESGLAGDPLHAHFVNDARDEILPPGHWFWDRARSGGIFVEHGVHFFDLFEWWFGRGEVLAAQQFKRPGCSIVDQVNCTIRYPESVLVNFYHGFHQASRRDHQEWMIVFENGTLTMREWVPTSLQLDVLATDGEVAAMQKLFDRPAIDVLERFTPHQRHFHSRHRAREADARFLLSVPAHSNKQELYGQMLRALMADQMKAIHTPGYRPLVNESSGMASLEVALMAQNLANVKSDSPL